MKCQLIVGITKTYFELKEYPVFEYRIFHTPFIHTHLTYGYIETAFVKLDSQKPVMFSDPRDV